MLFILSTYLLYTVWYCMYSDLFMQSTFLPSNILWSLSVCNFMKKNHYSYIYTKLLRFVYIPVTLLLTSCVSGSYDTAKKVSNLLFLRSYSIYMTGDTCKHMLFILWSIILVLYCAVQHVLLSLNGIINFVQSTFPSALYCNTCTMTYEWMCLRNPIIANALCTVLWPLNDVVYVIYLVPCTLLCCAACS